MTKRGAAVTALALLCLWQILSSVLQISVLPDPIAVIKVFLAELPNALGWHIVVSSGRVLAAMLLAVATATPIGLLIGQSRRWSRWLAPAVYLTYPIPKVVFLPIIMLFLGIGDVAKVFIIWLVLFYQVLVVVRDAASGVRPELVQSVYSLGASRWQLLRYVHLPACLPAVLTALRVSTGTAIAVLFISESFATQSGLGYFIMVEAWGRMAYPQMYAGVMAMSLLGLSIYFLLDQFEVRACQWVNPPAVTRQEPLERCGEEVGQSCSAETSATHIGKMPEDRGPQVRSMFSRIVSRYDLMNRLMTFGQDQHWRRKAADVALPRGGFGLDVACGTGDLALALREKGAERVVATDFCPDMLTAASGKLQKRGESEVFLVLGDAQHLPFPDNTFDFVVSGFLLRNVSSLEATLAEMTRVLKPQGRLVGLEITHMKPGPLTWPAKLYLRYLVPLMGWLVTSDRDAYAYLPVSLRRFPNAQRLAALMSEAGLERVSYELLGIGAVAVHVGFKPLARCRGLEAELEELPRASR